MDCLQLIDRISSVLCAALIGITAGAVIAFLLLPSFIYGRKPRRDE